MLIQWEAQSPNIDLWPPLPFLSMKNPTVFIIDCSQSPYFPVGFLRPVRFDEAAAILVCKSERDLGRVSKLPRGGERSWEVAGKIGRL